MIVIYSYGMWNEHGSPLFFNIAEGWQHGFHSMLLYYPARVSQDLNMGDMDKLESPDAEQELHGL